LDGHNKITMIKLKDDFEISVWVSIYTKSCGQQDDMWQDGDPAADIADKGIESLRLRMVDPSNPSKEESPKYSY